MPMRRWWKQRMGVVYILAAIELLIGCPLAFAGLRFFPELFRHPSPSAHLDDYLALAAMAVIGTATVLAAAVTIIHSRVSYGVIRTARIGAAASDVWMLLTGVGMWVISRQKEREVQRLLHQDEPRN
jgi:hypothetical protein